MSTIRNHWPWFAFVFCAALLISAYSCWINDSPQEALHNSMGDYSLGSAISACVSLPGQFAALLIYDRAYVSERDPDVWRIAWFVISGSAVFWTVFAIAIWKSLVWLRLKFQRKSNSQNRSQLSTHIP
jgi:hypothetical protein